jgi:acyl-CoA dehydrogenase
MQDLLTDSVSAVFQDHATPAAVRRAQEAGLDRLLWQHLVDGGFDRALAPEATGGSGLAMRDVAGVLQACGRFAAPVPLGEAMVAHAVAAACEAELPEGVFTAATARVEGDAIRATAVPWGASSDWVFAVEPGRRAFILPVGAAQASQHPGLGACNEADMQWRHQDAHAELAMPADLDWHATGACLRTAQIAGALDAVLEMTLRYAGERSQFGRPLAKFQAIQQQLAVLAEDAFAARMAAAVACDSAATLPDPTIAAAAKVVASAAAARSCGIAHAIHGAMGITAEHDLQLYTRRLLAWRMQYGSEQQWATRVGASLLGDSGTVWEFVRTTGTRSEAH